MSSEDPRNEIFNTLSKIFEKDPKLASYDAHGAFMKLEQLGVRHLYCIAIQKSGYESYVKFCSKEKLGCCTVETGLFDLHSIVGRLKVRMINPSLDWKVILRHIPCTRDLTWKKL